MCMECLELLADYFPVLVPIVAFAGLLAAQSAHISSVRKIAVSIFYGALVVVALGAIRSTMLRESTWLLHTASLGFLIIGASVIVIATTPLQTAE